MTGFAARFTPETLPGLRVVQHLFCSDRQVKDWKTQPVGMREAVVATGVGQSTGCDGIFLAELESKDRLENQLKSEMRCEITPVSTVLPVEMAPCQANPPSQA